METQLNLGGISADVIFKDIKNVHLTVHPPSGHVRIAAPKHMKLEVIRVFAISKLDWIRRQQMRLVKQEREAVREYIAGESHYIWGKRYLLKVFEIDEPPSLHLSAGKLFLKVRPSTTDHKKKSIVTQFYREQIKLAAPSILEKWSAVMGIKVKGFYVQQMKTKWGSCNPRRHTIRFNTQLAKKPKHLLEYIIVHELAHFLEPHHGHKFIRLMDKYMPNWRIARDELNSSPLPHEDWNC